MLISFFLMIIISTSLTVPGQPLPRFYADEVTFQELRNGLLCLEDQNDLAFFSLINELRMRVVC